MQGADAKFSYFFPMQTCAVADMFLEMVKGIIPRLVCHIAISCGFCDDRGCSDGGAGFVTTNYRLLFDFQTGDGKFSVNKQNITGRGEV